jgi:DNA adenine methylase
MWAGGKNKMIIKYQISPGIPYQDYDTYVEPFFGGGAMTIHIASKRPSGVKFVINDINTEIMNLYRTIKNDVQSFIEDCDILSNKYLSLNKTDRKAFFYEIRDIYTKHYTTLTPTKESATLYFLMKTAFNGIFQTMKDSNGRFATPAGLLNQKNHVYDKRNVIEWHEFLQNVDIYSGDWKDCCSKLKGKCFFFFDPPYRNSYTQYGQTFTDDDHKKLIDFSKKADNEGHLVYYCNRDTNDSFYEDNMGGLHHEMYDIVYTAGRRSTTSDGKKEAKKAKEILLYSSRLDSDKNDRPIQRTYSLYSTDQETLS